MKLLIDIGNTAIKIMSLENDELRPVSRFYVSELSFDVLDELLKSLSFDEIVVSSVSPKNSDYISEYFLMKYKLSPKYIKVGDYPSLKLELDNPNELGIDLYCDLIAGVDYAKEKKQPVLIIDLGTATKILLIDEDEVFSSCAIVPGITISKRLLSSSTALLPEVDTLETKKITECRNTVDVINSSVYFAHIEMVNGLINRFEKEIGKSCFYVVTGGNAKNVLKDIKEPHIYDEYLCFKGIKKILQHRG